MEDILDEVCSSEDLKVQFSSTNAITDGLMTFEKKYNEEVSRGEVSSITQFEYACFLVKSKYPADINKGVVLMEDLYQKKSGTGKRDYVYYLAVGNARLKEYEAASKFIEGLLKVEPSNRQALDLQAAIRKRMERDALKGAAIAGGVLLGLGALVGIGIAASRK